MTTTTEPTDDAEQDARPTVGMGADSTDIDHLADFDAWRAAAWATTDTLDRLTPGADR